MDVGTAVNPKNVEAQIEGSALYGISRVLYEDITMSNGSIDQGNFDTYDTLRMSDVPELDILLIEHGNYPAGIGEPAVALVPAAIANAIDDAVGAVAVHGYAGFAGLIICGFVLNGYPSSGYSVGAMWDGATYAAINPLGMFIGALIMFVVLGFIPGWIIAKVLHGMGKLRIPREVELAGLDYEIMEAAKEDEKSVASSSS